MANQGDPIANLIKTYHELNPNNVDELHAETDAISFLRYVSKNRPFVVRKGARDFDAVKKWDGKYLREAMKGKSVKVAVTPRGNADAIVQDEYGRLLFVEPHEVGEDFGMFLDYVQADVSPSPASQEAVKKVKYAQTQNDNLRAEYASLFRDVPTDISWATQALEQGPDAINFWLGNERSVTSLHKDNYENVYVQIRGQKHFVLLPPVEMPCVNETPVPFGRYQSSSGDSLDLSPEPYKDFNPVPVPIWDPTEPDVRATEHSGLSQPLYVNLDEGDMMYLPAMWYHKVSQSSGKEGFSCSVNYWYDMSFEGALWAQNDFLRISYNQQSKIVVYPDLRLGEKQANESGPPEEA